jgi:DNA-binding NarL/FixJ family response regulator
MFRLLVAEDHAAMRDKVVSILETEFSVVAAVGNGQEMLDLEAKVKPDVVILDISMPTMNGIEAATRLKQCHSNAKMILLTVHEEPEFLQAAMAVGALGYVIKSRLVSDLRLAVREVMAGRRFISPSLTMDHCENGSVDTGN